MNRTQRNANRDTAANLKYSLMQWNSRNRKLVPVAPAAQNGKQQAA